MKQHEIHLFIMPGCQVCPQMERLFHQMHQQGAITDLQIFDVQQHPELAQKHNIRSVPYYLINGVAFNGLKTRGEIDQLLQKDDEAKWIEMIREELSNGELESVEQVIRQYDAARKAMIELLMDADTALVVRIGLTAVIESLATGELLKDYEQSFIDMTAHEDERIAVDALYYLSLMETPACLSTLNEMAINGPDNLRAHALELLEDSVKNNVLH